MFGTSLTALTFAGALAAQDLPGPIDPEAGLKSLHARPGFRVERMLMEPATMDPVHFAWGADGALWIVEMADYPLGIDGKGKPGGRVRRIERDLGGGYAKGRNTVFLDGLAYPNSVAPYRNGVLISTAKAILFAEDTNGDGVADVRRTLIDVLHVGNPQHLLNGFDWGLDGWLYLNNVESRLRVTKTGKEYALQHRDARWRPDTGEFEPATGPTQFGRTRDDYDRWIGGDNSHPMWQYVLPDHYMRRNPGVTYPPARIEVPEIPGPAPVFPLSTTVARFNDLWAANRFTSANRPCIYRDDLFGPAFSNSAFVSEPVHNLVSRQTIAVEGLRYVGRRASDERQSEFLAATDGWFRPTALQTGPDGALWVADMHRQTIEHPEWIPKTLQSKLDLRAGHDRGRIYRVYPTNAAPRAIPNLARLGDAELVAALDAPGGWQRDTAMRLLLERRATGVAPALTELVKSCPRPQTRVQALCTLDGLHKLDAALLATALQDRHAEVRRQAVRLCEGRWEHAAAFIEPLLKLVVDADVEVRQQLAFTLGDCRDPRAGVALGQLARSDAAQPYFAAAVLSSLRPDNLTAVCAALGPAREEDAALTAPLWRLAEEWKQPAAATALADRLVVPPGTKIAAWRWKALAGLLDALETRGGKLVAPEKFAPLFDAARTNAKSTAAEPAALALLGRAAGGAEPGDAELLRSLLGPQSSTSVQLAAVEAVTRRGDYSGLATAWRSLSPSVRQLAAPRFLDRQAGVAALLAALADGRIRPSDLDAAVHSRLRAETKGELRQKAQTLLGGPTDVARTAVLAQYRPVLTRSGDARSGEEAFKKVCAACHKLGGAGNNVGPDLTAARSKTKDFWLESILDPNRAVEARFVAYLADLTDGRRLAGVVVEETATGVTLAGSDGKPVALRRQDIERMTSTGKSAMPEGLEKDLPPERMADLLAFLAAQVPPDAPKSVAGNRPAAVRAGTDGTLVCLPSAAELYGPNIVWEAQYRNLGYWSSDKDRAEWTVVVPKSGRYSLSVDYACPPEHAGQRFEIAVADRTIGGAVGATAGWDRYRAVWLSNARLSAGSTKLTVRAAGPLSGPLFDLKQVTLAPLDD